MRSWLLVLLLMVGVAISGWWSTVGFTWPVRAYVVVLIAVLPVLSIVQSVGLDAVDLAAIRRVPFYLSSSILLWLLALSALGLAVIGGVSLRDIGLVSLGAGDLLRWSAFALVAALLLVWIAYALGVRESAILEHILPRSRRERWVFIFLALSAGVCEELVFRGFLIPILARGSGSLLLGVLLSTLAFGALHAYQHALGAVRAALLGVVLTIPFLVTGSVLPSMIAHFVYDVLAGVWLGPWFLRGRMHEG